LINLIRVWGNNINTTAVLEDKVIEDK
jgi:hypothetical protein